MPRSTRRLITDRDLGWKRLGRALRDATVSAVEVGVQPGSTRKGDDGPTNAEIAAWHEYGTSRVPARPFMRPTFDAKWPVYRAFSSVLGRKVLFGALSKRQALMALGLKYASDVKAHVRAGIPPALAQSTIDRKGSSKALIDTAQLIGAITAVVKR